MMKPRIRERQFEERGPIPADLNEFSGLNMSDLREPKKQPNTYLRGLTSVERAMTAVDFVVPISGFRSTST